MRGRRATTPKKEKQEVKTRRAKKMKGAEAQRAKPSTPTRTFDALIEGEEQNGKQRKKEKRKKERKKKKKTRKR